MENDRIVNVDALKRHRRQLENDLTAFLTAKIGEIERDFGVQIIGVFVDMARVAEIGRPDRTIVRDATVDLIL